MNSILYIGYLNLDIQLCGKVVPQCGVLVVQDRTCGLRSEVAGVLRMNVLG